MLADPVTVGELQEQRTVQAARCAVVDILDGGEMPQPGSSSSCLEAFLLSQGHLRGGKSGWWPRQSGWDDAGVGRRAGVARP